MSLLLSSERTYAEMIDWIKFGEPEQLCFRVWESDLTMDTEFRLFIHTGTLVAISQYDHYTYYPHLQDMKDMLEAGLRELWQRVHPYVCEPNSSYIIDIAYLPTTDKFVGTVAHKIHQANRGTSDYWDCTFHNQRMVGR